MKKTNVFLIVAILIISSVAFFKIKSQTLNTQATYGYSVSDDETKAAFMIKKKIMDPEYTIVYSTSGCNSDRLIQTLNSIFSHSGIYGDTSGKGVLTRDGWYYGTKGSLALLEVSSSRIRLGLGAADIGSYILVREEVNSAMTSAIKNVEKKPEFPNEVLIPTAPEQEEEIIKGIEGNIGWGIPIIGACRGDDMKKGDWRQFCNKTMYRNGISIPNVCTDLTISWSFEHGYATKGVSRIETKAGNRVSYKIDNRPAALVYNDWWSGCMEHEVTQRSSIVQEDESVLWPPAPAIENSWGKYDFSLHPIYIGSEDKSLTVLANVYEGDKLIQFYVDRNLLLNGVSSSTETVIIKAGIEKNETDILCSGIMNSISQENHSDVPAIFSETIVENVHFIGHLAYSEQGSFGIVNHQANLSYSTILFLDEG